jgi:hypothetical protein
MVKNFTAGHHHYVKERRHRHPAGGWENDGMEAFIPLAESVRYSAFQSVKL